MAFSHDEERVRAERARAVGLFKYSLICEAADTRLSTRARGQLVRAIAEREHEGPLGQAIWDEPTGTPPRRRGRQGGIVSGRADPRNTPARAGTTGDARHSPGSTAEHPRAGGDDAQGDKVYAHGRGTPPRGRGRPGLGQRGPAGGRNTPARAGTTVR